MRSLHFVVALGGAKEGVQVSERRGVVPNIGAVVVGVEVGIGRGGEVVVDFPRELVAAVV